MRGAGTLGGLLGMFSLLDADEANAAVFAKDGRRLLHLLNKAEKGALSKAEPDFVFQERLPKDIFAAAQRDNGAFHTRKFAASMDNIQHYWDARHGQMSNQQIEDLIESVIAGNNRFYVRANNPFAESIAVLGNHSGARGSLRPSLNYTYLHQVNPINNKRLSKMKSLTEASDGSAGHPLTSASMMQGLRSKRVSADDASLGNNIPGINFSGKALLPLSVGGAAAFAPPMAQANIPMLPEPPLVVDPIMDPIGIFSTLIGPGSLQLKALDTALTLDGGLLQMFEEEAEQ